MGRECLGQRPRPVRAGDLPGHSRQALEGAALVFEQAVGGGDRHLVLTVAPFAQQHGAGREVDVARTRPQLDLGMLGTPRPLLLTERSVSSLAPISLAMQWRRTWRPVCSFLVEAFRSYLMSTCVH